MENKCEYKNKCNVSKVLISALMAFIVVCGIMLFIMFKYHQEVNKSFQNSIGKTAEVLASIKVGNKQHKQVIISQELATAITKLNQNEYDIFLRRYYESQNNWLNIWLTILTLLLGFLGLIIPLCFLKFYESKKEEFNIVIKEMEKKKQTMTQDLEEVKKYVEKAKASEQRVEFNRYLVSAIRESSQKNYSDALERINKALELAPKNINAICIKADILSHMNRYEEAIPLYEEFLKHRKNIAVYNQYGNSLCKVKKYQEAIQALTDSIKLSSSDYRCFSNRGIIFMEMGNLKRAQQDFNTALSLVPSSSNPEPILYNLTECYLKQKNFTKALEFLTNFINHLQVPYIFNDDKPKWLKYLKNDLTKPEVTRIASLINTLKIKKRNE